MLCNSCLALGPIHLTRNARKQICQPPPPGLAGHLIAHHPSLSGCDATLMATLASQWLFPLPLLSLMVIFPEAFFLGNLGCRLYPNPLCPYISSATCSLVSWPSGSAQTQRFGDDSLSSQLWEMLAEAETRTCLRPVYRPRHNVAGRWWHARVQKWPFSG